MNNEVFFGKNSLRFYYYRYKDSSYYMLSIIVLTIVTCFLLVFNFIIPSMEQWLSIRSEVLATRERIAVITDNINYMSAVDKSLIANQVSVVSNALPPEKDLGAILGSLSQAAMQSGVSLQDYSFQVGHVSSASAALGANTKDSMVTITLLINGDVNDVDRFIQAATKTLPLSEIVQIDGAAGSINLTMNYFQRELPKVTLKDDQPIPRVVETNATLINSLASWQVPQQVEQVGAPTNESVPLF